MGSGQPPVSDIWREIAGLSDGFVDGGIDDRIVGRGPQGRPQIGGIVLPQAHIEHPRAGEPHAVAAFAEIVAQRCDETEPPAGLAHAHITRRSPGAVVQRIHREAFRKLCLHQRQGQILLGAVGIDIAHRHRFDERDVHVAAMGPGYQFGDFVIVHAAQRHDIDLDLKASLLRRVDAGDHFGKVAPAGDAAEFVRVQCVDGNVDPLDAAVDQFGSKARELTAVRRQRQLLQASSLEVTPDRAEQLHDIAPHQRLSARQSQLVHAFADEGAAQPVELFQRQDVGLGQERHVFGHAVHAAKIAAVGNGDA